MDTTLDRPEDSRVSVRGLDDSQTVDGAGQIVRVLDGVELQRQTSHLDPRGTLTEVINFDTPFWREPIVYSYSLTVNPGRIKGWGMHLRQVDRHYVHCGTVRFVLFDARESSSTHGKIQTLTLGDEARGLVRIPAGVWHAAQNVGETVAHITNFPTIAYDHTNPDKQILPLDSDEIPWSFARLDDYPR